MASFSFVIMALLFTHSYNKWTHFLYVQFPLLTVRIHVSLLSLITLSCLFWRDQVTHLLSHSPSCVRTAEIQHYWSHTIAEVWTLMGGGIWAPGKDHTLLQLMLNPKWQTIFRLKNLNWARGKSQPSVIHNLGYNQFKQLPLSIAAAAGDEIFQVTQAWCFYS